METTIVSPNENQKIASNGVMGMLFLLVTEIMFFAGLISAYIVNRAGNMLWPPYNQPRLPVEVTAINTVILMCSALVFYFFFKKFNSKKNALSLLSLSILLDATFLCVQGSEWIKLIHYGLTTSSSLYGAFFYTIIGIHGLHVLVGLFILLYLFFTLKNNTVSFENAKNKIIVSGMYLYFVVAIWPVLYFLVYLF